MALTKVQTIGIETGISLTGVTTVTTLNASTDTLSVGGTVNFGGNVSIAGTLTYEDVTNIDAVGLITARNGIKVDDLGVQVGTGATIDGATNTLTFLTNGSERARIDSTGRLLVGASSNIPGLGGFDFQIGGAVAGSSIAQATFEDDNEGPIHRFYHSRNATVGSHTIVQDNDQLGQIQFLGSDGASIVEAARILCNVDGTPGTNDMPGRIVFQTTADGASSPTERMRITSSGDLCFGSTVGANNDGSGISIYNASYPRISFRNSTTGNTTSDGSQLYLVNSDLYVTNNENANLIFRTNETERVRIDSSGNFGIGAASPAAKLDVAGNQIFTAANPQIQFNAGGPIIRLPSANTLAFLTDSTNERMRIDSSGRLLLGTSTTSNVAQTIYSTENSAINFQNSNTGTGSGNGFYVGTSTGTTSYVWNYENDSLIFATNNTERMRVDSSGNIGIGSASPSQTLDVVGNVRIGSAAGSALIKVGKGATENRYAYIDFVGDTTYSDYGLRLIRNNSGANTTSVLVHRGTGGLQINAQDAGNIQFLTSNTERARIDSSGQLCIGCTSFNTSVSGVTILEQNSNYGRINLVKTASGVRDALALYYSGTYVGGVQYNDTSTTYNTSSDYRLKENVVDIADGIDRVKQLQPKRFNFIANASTTVDGFLAHEAQTVVPEAVTGTHNEVDDDGNAVMQGIDTSKLVPLLTAALQEEIAKREALEVRIAALEG